jgi:hypothetical protein
MSFVSNCGKFKLYTVLNGLLFPTPTHPRISFERAIEYSVKSRSESFCAKPRDEDRDEVEFATGRSTKRPTFQIDKFVQNSIDTYKDFLK